MEHVTFESLPKAVNELLQKMDLLLSQYQLIAVKEEPDRFFDLDQLREYLPEKPARQTVYGWVNDRIVPYEKHGKRLYFRKSQIDSWLLNGRKII